MILSSADAVFLVRLGINDHRRMSELWFLFVSPAGVEVQHNIIPGGASAAAKALDAGNSPPPCCPGCGLLNGA